MSLALDWVPGKELDDRFTLRAGLCDVVETSGTVVEADQFVAEVATLGGSACAEKTFEQFPSLLGRQLEHPLPAFTQAQRLHEPVLLHLQHWAIRTSRPSSLLLPRVRRDLSERDSGVPRGGGRGLRVLEHPHQPLLDLNAASRFTTA